MSQDKTKTSFLTHFDRYRPGKTGEAISILKHRHHRGLEGLPTDTGDLAFSFVYMLSCLMQRYNFGNNETSGFREVIYESTPIFSQAWRHLERKEFLLRGGRVIWGAPSYQKLLKTSLVFRNPLLIPNNCEHDWLDKKQLVSCAVAGDRVVSDLMGKTSSERAVAWVTCAGGYVRRGMTIVELSLTVSHWLFRELSWLRSHNQNPPPSLTSLG